MPASDPHSRLERREEPAAPGTPPAEPDGRGSGRVHSAVVWGQGLYTQLEERRPQSQTVEIGFRWLERDAQIAGGVLGGGLAYRFFFWVLSLTLLFSGGLGLASHSGVNVETAARESGLTSAVSETVASAAQQSESGRWVLLLLGLWLTFWFSWGLLRALRLVHAAAWRVLPGSIHRPLSALGVVLAAPLAFALLEVGFGWIRVNIGVLPGAFAMVVAGLAFGATWLWISMKLPAPDVPWTAFIPGALLFGIAAEAIHLFTIYFLADKLASAQSHYGALGLAATMLFYLWLIGRVVVWAAELNAVVRDVDTPARHRRSQGPSSSPSAALPVDRSADRGVERG